MQVERGDHGPVDDVERKVDELTARVMASGGTRHERRASDGRYIEFTLKPLSDGSRLGLYRDITDHKRREEALAAAKEDAERTRELMRTVLDNMNDGVTLYGEDGGWRISNRKHVDLLQYPPGALQPGVSIRDLIRIQVERGDYGPIADVAGKVEELTARAMQSGGSRYERRTASRPIRRVHVQAAERRQPARALPRHHRAEAARGGAGHRQGGRRAHPRGPADRARQHE